MADLHLGGRSAAGALDCPPEAQNAARRADCRRGLGLPPERAPAAWRADCCRGLGLPLESAARYLARVPGCGRRRGRLHMLADPQSHEASDTRSAISRFSSLAHGETDTRSVMYIQSSCCRALSRPIKDLLSAASPKFAILRILTDLLSADPPQANRLPLRPLSAPSLPPTPAHLGRRLPPQRCPKSNNRPPAESQEAAIIE